MAALLLTSCVQRAVSPWDLQCTPPKLQPEMIQPTESFTCLVILNVETEAKCGSKSCSFLSELDWLTIPSTTDLRRV